MTSTRPWLGAYPPNMPTDIDPNTYRSLAEMLDEALVAHAEREAYCFMGHTLSYAEIDRQSRALAAYFQHIGLKAGDRLAVMMPNVPQHPVVAIAAIRAGLILVNVNPLYTARELEHQLKDAGATAIVVLEAFASTLADCISRTSVKHVVLASVGDMLGTLKGFVVNAVVRHVKKAVRPFKLVGAVQFNAAVARGQRAEFKRPALHGDSIALLQYTGGTTGVSKGATLLHRNIVANVLQTEAWNQPMMARVPAGEQPCVVCALPLYHVFAFTVVMMMSIKLGAKVILIPDPRDIKGLLSELARHRFHCFPAVNTLFAALLNHRDFNRVDWSHLLIAAGGGMAVQSPVAQRWLERTGCFISEGYGLSETSPTATANPLTNTAFTGSIGVPLPSTWLRCINDAGDEVPVGEPGEIAIKGPQVMAGYWQRDDETAKVMTADGYFRTGDVGVMGADGYFKIVDRKKDMVLVSGFNVYPNEVEEVVAGLAGVRECAVVGVPDAATGEAVKLVIVRGDEALDEATVRAYCQSHMTGYKRPKFVEFRDSLPKTPVGKILRRELREPAAAVAHAARA